MVVPTYRTWLKEWTMLTTRIQGLAVVSRDTRNHHEVEEQKRTSLKLPMVVPQPWPCYQALSSSSSVPGKSGFTPSPLKELLTKNLSEQGPSEQLWRLPSILFHGLSEQQVFTRNIMDRHNSSLPARDHRSDYRPHFRPGATSTHSSTREPSWSSLA